MDREQFIKTLTDAKLYDLTQGCSIFTPPWPGEKALEIHFFKRVTGAYGGGQGANGQLLNWSNTVGTRIFVTASDEENKLGYLLAVDLKDGKKVWQKEFDVGYLNLHEENKLAMSSPAVDDSHIYTIWYSKEKVFLLALSHEGVQQWRAEFDGIESSHGAGGSLMLTDKNVIFTREQEKESSYKSSWIAVDKHSGNTAWELDRNTAVANSFSTPTLIEIENIPAQLVFTSHAHGITSLSPETGEIVWERENLLTARAIASPIYSDGYIVASRKGEALVLALDTKTGQAADTIHYAFPRSLSPYVPTPIVVDDFLFLFMDNGLIACARLATGEIVWKERPAGGFYGSPILVNGNLYCTTKEGEVIVIKADPVYQLLGIHPLGEGSFATPAVTQSGMLFRTFTQLMLLGNED